MPSSRRSSSTGRSRYCAGSARAPGRERLAGRLHRTAGDVGLSRRRRRATRPDLGVLRDGRRPCRRRARCGQICCSTVTSPWPTSAAAVCTVDVRRAADDLEPHPRGRVVVEPFGEGDVLVGDGVPDAAAYALAVGRVGDAAGQVPQVRAGRGPCGQRHRPQPVEQLGDRRGAVDHLSRRRRGAFLHRVERCAGRRGPCRVRRRACPSAPRTANAVCTEPKPRIAPHGGLFV